MEEKKWFLLVDAQVIGPYSQAELEDQFHKAPQALVWGRGHTQWISRDRWSKMAEQGTLSGASIERQERLWRIADGGNELQPMNHSEMIHYLKNKPDLSSVRLWTEGYSEWREIYQIHKIMDELGVSRRTHPRVPLTGNVQCEGAGGTFTARLLSLSEGGLGATDSQQVKIGERLKIVVKSTSFPSPIPATVEVVYVGNDGYFGMKFMALQSESQSLIIEYIKKFLGSNPDLK